MKKNILRLISVCLTLFYIAGAGSCAAQENTARVKPKPYRLLKTIKLPGNESYSELTMDSAARRLYITRFDRVMVMDTDSYELKAEIPGTAGANSIALAGDLGRGFANHRSSGSITIFDTTYFTTIGEINISKNPDALLYDPATRRLFVFHGPGGEATVIEAVGGAVAGKIDLGGQIKFSAADGKGRVFVNLMDKDRIAVINSLTLTVTAQWPLSPCEAPFAMAGDAGNKRLFTSCKNNMIAMVNTDTGVVVSTVSAGDRANTLAFDPATGLLFGSGTGGNALSAAREDSPDKFSPVMIVSTPAEFPFAALDERTHRIFIITADYKRPAPAAAPVLTKPQPFEGQAPSQPQKNPIRNKRIVEPGTVRLLVLGY